NDEAKGQIEEVISNSDIDLSNLEDGATTLIESVEFETQRQLNELKTSFLELEENLQNRQGENAERQVKWERRIIVKRGEAINEDRLQKLQDRYEERINEIQAEADASSTGTTIMSGAEGELISDEASEAIRK